MSNEISKLAVFSFDFEDCLYLQRIRLMVWILIIYRMKDLFRVLSIGLAVCTIECSAQTVSGNVGGYRCVDLGLGSGLKWATCNIGASSPTEYGDF